MDRGFRGPEEELERTVYVNGLCYETTEETLKNFFEECGEIERIKLPRYQDSNRNIGYCHVVFETKGGAQEALKRDGEYLDRRYLKIELARGNKPIEKLNGGNEGSSSDSKTVFVKNLPYDTNEAEVNDYFSVCGPVESVRLVYNSVHKHFKGFGYVDFKNRSSVKEAMRLDGKVFKGRALVIDVDNAKPKEGFKYRGTEENKKFFSSRQDEKKRLNDDIIQYKSKHKVQNFEPDYQ